MRRLAYFVLGVSTMFAGSEASITVCNKACKKGFHCVGGKCVPETPSISVTCTADKDCAVTENCVSSRCTKKVTPLTCSPSCKMGQTCTNGKCVPPSEKLCLKACSADQHCVNGQCVSKCAKIKCPLGQSCKSGVCVQNPVIRQCPVCVSGTHCSNGVCVSDVCTPACTGDSVCVKGRCDAPSFKTCKKTCATGTSCVNGECVKTPTPPTPPTVNKCASVKCGKNQLCQNGVCVSSIGRCKVNYDCKLGQKCQATSCVDSCKNVVCSGGKVCSKGVCQNLQCGKIQCPSGSFCQDNRCVPEIFTCPAISITNSKTCTNPRPTTCPTPAKNIRNTATSYHFCGIKSDRTRTQFASECQACKDTRVSYYFQSSCYWAPFICSKGDTCIDSYCSSPCQKDEECPYDWQMCSEGSCKDKCSTMKCAKGPCKYGQCAFQKTATSCTTTGTKSTCKNENQSCVNNYCTDLCLRQPCKANQKCKKGICEPIPAPAAPVAVTPASTAPAVTPTPNTPSVTPNQPAPSSTP